MEQEIIARLQKWENETMFSPELLPDNFKELVLVVLRFNSPFNLRMPVDFFKQLVSNETGEYSLMEVSCICHAAKLRNCYEMVMTMPEYIAFQEAIEELSKAYMNMSGAKKSAITNQVMATVAAEKSVPDHKKTIKLPVPQS